MSDAPFIDPRAIVDTDKVGPRTQIYEFTHVLKGAVIGADCNLNSHVFVGPNVPFTNDRRPRSRRPVPHPETVVKTGASLGAGAVIGPGVVIGEWAMVGMGAVVTRNVEPHAVVFGNPARRQGWACFCGERADAPPSKCSH